MTVWGRNFVTEIPFCIYYNNYTTKRLTVSTFDPVGFDRCFLPNDPIDQLAL